MIYEYGQGREAGIEVGLGNEIFCVGKHSQKL